MLLWSCCAAASKGGEQMQYLKKKPETAVLLLLLGLVVLAGIALAVLTASNRKAEQAASEAADGSIPVLAIPVSYTHLTLPTT